ncbi:hypothetical protein [Candidatus Methanoperedens nitratireducens]|uniref:Uncharacterized protein n=1 Tax=Candidatus Methanoperedens nitratireducens TaxID=1392998 RepID=A0A284VTA3_9EURY|nr:hypothetical protein [Candidatus Methanoperedens nitroreducens]SNQ62428.1 hypothetical protein MNV_710004 [Candidatus Methanoperedens nitroreducens]
MISSNKFTEKSLVEDYIIEKLIDNGWRFRPSDEPSISWNNVDISGLYGIEMYGKKP